MLVLRNSCLIQPLLIIKLYFVNKVTELRLIRIKLFLPYNQPIFISYVTINVTLNVTINESIFRNSFT